jgi:hypothetical protein
MVLNLAILALREFKPFEAASHSESMKISSKLLIIQSTFVLLCLSANGQVMTPEMLWTLGRVSPVGTSDD